MQKRSNYLSPAVLSILALSCHWTCAAQAQTLRDNPALTGSEPAQPFLFEEYSCQRDMAEQSSRHLGQVIRGVYREWTETFRIKGQQRSILCVTQIRPDPRQFALIEAQEFLNNSSHIGQLNASAPALAVAKASASSEELVGIPAGSSVLSMTRAVEPSTISASETDSGVAAPTHLQALLKSSAAPDNYAILDVGHGRVLSSLTAQQASANLASQQSQSNLARAQTLNVDERERVNSTSAPWNLIGQLIVTWRDGTQAACTGMLVSPYVVLTAGQCAHNRERGGFAARASFAPGQMQAVTLGAVTQPAARYADFVESSGHWTAISGGETLQTTDARYDFAAYHFVQPWNFATYMPVLYDDTSNGTFNTAGYPIDVGNSKSFNQGMWYSTGPQTARSVNFLKSFQVREFIMDVSSGNTGGPIWTYDGTTRNFVGIVSYGGDDLTGGVWFGGENKAVISAFVSWVPGQSAPTHGSEDLRVPMIFPAGNLVADSYLRFFNPTLQAGQVTVRFADGETGVALGTWTSPAVAPNSSVQYTMADIEPQAVPPISGSRKHHYTANISADFRGYFQHVLWNRVGRSLTNLSGCANGLSDDATHLINLHSSVLPDYPSVIVAHNTGLIAADAVISVYDSKDGSRLGGIIVPAIPANSSANFSVSDVETALNFTPSSTQYHYNLFLEGNFQGYVQHLVYNNGAGLITNMTAKCVLPSR